jgi:hypothetical protein
MMKIAFITTKAGGGAGKVHGGTILFKGRVFLKYKNPYNPESRKPA